MLVLFVKVSVDKSRHCYGFEILFNVSANTSLFIVLMADGEVQKEFGLTCKHLNMEKRILTLADILTVNDDMALYNH